MKHLFLLAIAAALLAGCTTILEQPPERALPKNAGKELTLCRELLMAFLKNNPSEFVELLPEEQRARFDEKKFNSTRGYIVETLGQPISFQYLTSLEFVAVTPHIWKIRFERIDKDKKIIHSEALFRIITGKTSDKEIAILGFNFL